MSKQPLLFAILTLGLAACASTSNPPGPEGTGDHKAGYLQGRSDTVKQEYWIVQNQQKNLHPATQPRITYLPITTGSTTNNGVVTVPTTEYIPVQESK
jgi:hypothetical protein